MRSTIKHIDSSFRDPDGYVFEYKRELFRAVNYSYKPAYDLLLSSGLYQILIERSLLLPFEEVNPSRFGLNDVYKVLKPQFIEVITYPYEWSFNMLKDASLLA